MNSEEWWLIFREASELRRHLEAAEKDLTYQQKGQAISEIKKAAHDLLLRSEIPQPLRLLVVQLWGGFQTVADRWPGEKFALLWIEAEQPKGTGNKKLARLLNEQENSAIDKTQVGRWRGDPEYQYLVAAKRAERDIEQGDSSSE